MAASGFYEELVIEVADAPAAQCLMGNFGSRRVEDPIAKTIIGLPEEKVTTELFFGHGNRPGHWPRLPDDLIDVTCQAVKALRGEKPGGHHDAAFKEAFPLSRGQISLGLFHRRIVGRAG